jgi:WD40 repeat protein
VGELITNGGWIFLFSRTSSTPLWRSRVGDWICPIAISLDGNYIAGGGNYYIGNRIVYLFSGDNDMPLWSHQTSGFVRSVAISSDGSHIAAGSTEREVYLFSRASGTPLWGYQTGGSIFFVAISSDGGYVVTGDSDHKIHFFSENILTSFKVTIAFIKPDGTPLTNTVIYYGALPEMKTRLLGTTDSQGKITSTNPALAGRTIYFKSSDGRYVGSISVGATAGEVTAELTEVSKFPILWVVTTIAMVAAAIGAVTLIKKRKYHGTQII